jgi:hypothetical protein
LYLILESLFRMVSEGRGKVFRFRRNSFGMSSLMPIPILENNDDIKMSSIKLIKRLFVYGLWVDCVPVRNVAKIL